MMCDEFAATQVVLREREARDRCWWAEMADCFHDESTVTISWFQGSGADFVAQSKAMTERGVSSAGASDRPDPLRPRCGDPARGRRNLSERRWCGLRVERILPAPLPRNEDRWRVEGLGNRGRLRARRPSPAGTRGAHRRR